MSKLSESWNSVYFNGRLSPLVLDQLAALEQPAERPEVLYFLERAFANMQRSRFPATAFTVELAGQFSHIVRMVRDAWQGTIPPFTLEDRHHKIDDVVENHPWFQHHPGGTFLDVGCGFPPLTTVATARRFPKWQVLGMDPALPHYLLKNEQGDYALFDEQGTLQYFQGGHGRSLAVWRDPESAREYFTDLLKQVRSGKMAAELEAAGMVDNGRIRLIKNPVRQYEQPNLTFRNGRIGTTQLPQVDIIRCFNVLFYFDLPFRQQALTWFATLLTEEGLALCGVNGFHSTRCRYTIYRRDNGCLKEESFAFSLDNVRPLGAISWSTFHDDDEQMNLLATLVGIIRDDTGFQRAFDTRLDMLLEDYGLYRRGEDGFLQEIASEMTAVEKEKHQCHIFELLDQEGYVTGATAVLRRAGYQAWRNHAGHIAIRRHHER